MNAADKKRKKKKAKQTHARYTLLFFILCFIFFIGAEKTEFISALDVEADPMWYGNLTDGVSSDWNPLVTLTQSLGGSAKRWLNLWAQNVDVSQNVSAQYYHGNISEAVFPVSSCAGTDKAKGLNASGGVTCTSDTTYNATYNSWAYNQTINLDYAGFYAGGEAYNGSTFNATYDAHVTNLTAHELYNGSTFNASYNTHVNNISAHTPYNGSTFNATYNTHIGNFTAHNDTWWYNQTANFNLSWNFNQTKGFNLTWNFNQTTALDYLGFYTTYNATYNTHIGNFTAHNSTWWYNQTANFNLSWNFNQTKGFNLTWNYNQTIGLNLGGGGSILSACTGTDKVTSHLANGSVTCGTDLQGSGAGRTFYEVHTNITTNNYTVYNTTVLAMPVSANTNYTYQCELIAVTAAAATGVQFNTSFPISPRLNNIAYNIPTTAALPGYWICTNPNGKTGNPSCTAASLAGLTTGLPVTITGRLRTSSNAGVINITFKSEITTSPVQIVQGSYCYIELENSAA